MNVGTGFTLRVRRCEWCGRRIYGTGPSCKYHADLAKLLANVYEGKP